MLPLEEKLAGMEPEEQAEYRDMVREAYQHEEFADLVRLVLRDLEQSIIGTIRSGPESTEQLWSMTGAMQNIQLVQALLFNKENFDAPGTDAA